jgi:hypothetical protein
MSEEAYATLPREQRSAGTGQAAGVVFRRAAKQNRGDVAAAAECGVLLTPQRRLTDRRIVSSHPADQLANLEIDWGDT